MITLALKLAVLLSVLLPCEAELLFVGDAMAHGPQLRAALQPDGTYDFTPCFDALRTEISGADYAVVNLETPVSGGNYSGYPMFNAPDSYVDALRDAGFDLFLTANNHTLDRGDAGLKKTIHLLDSLGLDHLGTYVNATERSRRLPMIAEVKGYRVGMLNYTYGTNGLKAKGDVVVDYIDRDVIAQDVKALRNAGAEIIIANMHWGEEYHLQPVASEKSMADYLTSLGVDVIMGSHPHVVQPVETRTNPITGTSVQVIYSLGNFISNQQDTNSRGGLMVKLRLRRHGGKVTVSAPECSLFYCSHPTGTQRNYKLLRVDSVPEVWRRQAQDFRSAVPIPGIR
jgi:putative uncharacterized protein (fragment)